MGKLQLIGDRAELESLDDFTLCDRVWDQVVTAYGEVSEKWWSFLYRRCDYPESIYALRTPPHWRIGYLIHAFEYDHLKGGIREFFSNHGGLTNRQTRAALEAVGARRAAEILNEACRAYEPLRRRLLSEDDKTVDAAQAVLDEALAPLSRALRALPHGDSPRGLLAIFIRSNLDRYLRAK